MTSYLSLLLPILFAPVLGVIGRELLRRRGRPKAGKRIMLASLAAGAMVAVIPLLVDFHIAGALHGSFIVRVLIPGAGSVAGAMALAEVMKSRLGRGDVLHNLGRLPSARSQGWIALMTAFVLLFGELPLIIDGRVSIAAQLPMYLFALVSLIVTIVESLGHACIAENGIWTGKALLEWGEIAQWQFERVDGAEVLRVTLEEGAQRRMKITLTDVQKKMLDDVLERRLPHLKARQPVLSAT